MPRVERAATFTAMPSASVMPTISAASITAAGPSGVVTSPYAATRRAPPAPVSARVRRSPPRDSTASSVPSPPSAIGQARISASGHTRRRPRAIAAQTAAASSEPLNESGASTTVGGRAAVMADEIAGLGGFAIVARR